jgi:hypothetical protein
MNETGDGAYDTFLAETDGVPPAIDSGRGVREQGAALRPRGRRRIRALAAVAPSPRRA